MSFLSRTAPLNGPTIAIVGAGPAGLSLAKLLQDQNVGRVTVFEADTRVGGKSLSVPYRGAVLEMGTCYSTLEHTTTNAWMRDLGIEQYSLGRQTMAGQSFLTYLREGPGASILSEGYRYRTTWMDLTQRLAASPEDPAVRAEAAMSAEEWLARNDFVRMRRFMLRAMTALGYGFLDEVSVAQTMRWCTPKLIYSGLLNQLKMPSGGWQAFWEKISERLDVRLGEPVSAIDRSGGGVRIATPLGDYRFDHVAVSIPLDDLASVMALTNAEREIEQAVEWGGYVVSLCEVENWFTGHVSESYPEALEPQAGKGRMITARRERRTRRAGSNVRTYMTGQYHGGLSRDQLVRTLIADIEARGAKVRKVVMQKPWKYFPRYKREAIADGLLPRMSDVQGANRTWYTGATFSHESVANVVAFNVDLAQRMKASLAGAAQAPILSGVANAL